MSPKTVQLAGSEGAREYVTLTVGDQLFGVPVLAVRDVLRAQRITRIPRSSAEIAGILNLRGRIVTAVDLRVRLGLPARTDTDEPMHVVVEDGGEPYGLVVDSVGDVMDLMDKDWEPTPRNLGKNLAAVSTGVYRLKGGLLVILDIGSVLGKKAA